MGLALWRFDEYGARQEAGHYSTRFGYRQNALLGVREPITNGLLNPYFLNNAEFWTASAGLLYASRVMKVPFGTGAIELAKTDSASTAYEYLRYQWVSGHVGYSSGMWDVFAVDGSALAHVSVYAKGRKGAQIRLGLKENVVSGWSAYETFTLSENDTWERFVATVTPAIPQGSTTETDYAVDIGITGTYMGPVSVTAAQFVYGHPISPPFVHEGIGSIRSASFTAGGGQAGYTNVYVPVPDDLIKTTGAIAFWQNLDGLHSFQDWLFKFKTALNGSDATVGTGTVNDVWGAFLQYDVNEYVQLVVSVPDSFGNMYETVVFKLGLTVDEFVGTWGHFLIQWYNGTFRAFYNAVPLATTTPQTLPLYFNRTPTILLLMADKDDEAAQQSVGLQEGFTIYDRTFTQEYVKYLYSHGDNLVTGAIAHISLHEDIVLEVGQAIGFEGPGDYRVAVDGYAPGTSVGQPTVRFDSGKESEGPYIVQERYPRILEPLSFEVMNINNSELSASRKISQINNVLQRSGTYQRLVLQYAPIGSARNLRAEVSAAYLTIPAQWTGIAQVAQVLKGLKIDIERDQFRGGRKTLGNVMVPKAIPFSFSSTEHYGVILLPPVEGNLPAPMTLTVEHDVTVNSDNYPDPQPESWTLALRRRKSLEPPLYVLSSQALYHTGSPITIETGAGEVNGGYAHVASTVTSLPIIGTYVWLGDWVSSLSDSDPHTDVTVLAKSSNYGTYRVFVLAKSSGEVGIRMTVGDTQYVSAVNTTNWNMVDMGAVAYPGKAILRTQFHGWPDGEVSLEATRLNADDDTLDIAGVFFMPIDDGFLQVYSTISGVGESYVDSSGNISNPGLLAGYVGGLMLSSSVPTEVRGYSLGSPSGELYTAWAPHDSELRMTIEYVPTYTGLGDD